MAELTYTVLAEKAAEKMAAGDLPGACEDMEAAWQKAKTELGEAHPDALMLQNDLAVYCGAAGDYARALELAQRALAAREQLLGPEAEETLASRHNVAHALLCLGRAEEALPFAEEVYRRRGEEGPVALQGMMNLAACYGAAGRTDEALALYGKSLTIQQKLFGEKHPDTVAAMSAMAGMLRSAGQVEESVRLAKRALVLTDETMGSTHPKTAEAIEDLAACYAAAQKPEKAVKLLEQALEILRQTLSDRHPRTVGVKNHLAMSHVAAGQFEEALKLFEETVQDYTSIFGEQHAAVADALQNCALCCADMGQEERALTHYRRLWRLKEKLFGETAASTLLTMQDTGMQTIQCGRAEKGFALLREAADKMTAAFGKGSPQALQAAERLAEAYARNNRPDRAIHTLETALEGAAEGPAVLRLKGQLATLYYDTEELEKATELSGEVAGQMLAAMGEEDPEALNVMTVLYSSAAELGRLDQAKETAERCLQLQQKAYGPDHGETLFTMTRLAGIYSDSGETDRALELVKQAAELAKKSGMEANGRQAILYSAARIAAGAADYETVAAMGRELQKLAPKGSIPYIHALQITADGENGRGNYKKAEEAIRSAIDGAMSALAPGEYFSFYFTLADALAGQGDAAGASHAAKQAAEICAKAFGEQDPRTLKARNYVESLSSS